MIQQFVLTVLIGIGAAAVPYRINVNDEVGIDDGKQRNKRQDAVTCEDGWVNYERSCYFFSDEATTWDDGMAKCVQKGSKLVEINDANENQFLATEQRNFGHVESFIGANDVAEEGNWVWSISGQTMNYSSWFPGNPNNHGGDQDCAVLLGDRWDDNHCGGPFKYICEKIDFCDPNPCMNNGVCADQGDGYTCTCVNGYAGNNCETAILSVESCTTLGVNYTVYSGQENGVTYIEGTTSSDCMKTLSGLDSESFLLNFETCNVEPALNSSTNSIEIKLVVQHKADVTTEDDFRYTIKCTFGENEDIVVTAEAWGKAKDDVNDIAVDVNPLPVMRLYWIADASAIIYEQMSDSTTVTLGTSLRQEIKLATNVPNYNLLVKTCSMEAKSLDDTLLTELVLLDTETSCSRLGGDIYPDFSYLTDDVTIDNTQFTAPYARTEFKAFIPTLPNIDLAGTSVKLVIKCVVSICFGESDACKQPTCGKRRRRRATGESLTVRSYDDLTGTFQIIVANEKGNATEKPTNNEHVKQRKEEELVGSLKFWAILISALVVVIVAIVVTTGVVLRMKKGKGHGDPMAKEKNQKQGGRKGGFCLWRVVR
ncbi:uncharacterized protein LOC123542037 [Mercenaria mercenaria]|uniref:uncharacterized protein LOC123542037 n=1 Tax=Mercenaria mercenaria TaxID=6596 RepID=UPI00234F4E2E|nr:uncharacterized protein LOC123542037 [Mercenaria mercenaria]